MNADPGTELEVVRNDGTPDVRIPDAEIVDLPVRPELPVATGRPKPIPAPWQTTAVERRPVVASWLQTAEQRSQAARWAVGHAFYVLLFHLARIPLYSLRVALWSPRGAWRLSSRYVGWVLDVDSWPMIWQAKEARSIPEYRGLRKESAKRVKPRLVAMAVWLAVAAGLLTWMTLAGMTLLLWLVTAVAVAACARAGQNPDRPLMEHAVVEGRFRKLSSGIVMRSFMAAKLCTEDEPITFCGPIQRDGAGWTFIVDLPFGRTATQAMTAREKIASGLDVDERCLFLQRIRGASGSARRVKGWTADEDPLTVPAGPSPLIEATRVNFWDGFDWGVDERGTVIRLNLLWQSLLVGAIPRQGKALALDTPIPTPSGWTTMGELADGDQVFDERGQPCRVVTAHQVRHARPCYRVTFSDGSTIVADADHLWQVETRSGRVNGTPEKVLTTAELIPRVRVEADGRVNYSVRAAEPLQLPDADLPVAPYTLGAWLGDGTTVHSYITAHNSDSEILDEIRAEGYVLSEQPSQRVGGTGCYSIGGLRPHLRAAGVLGNKHIPEVYFRASEAQRRALLAGLLDTDGWVEFGGIRFVSTRQQLAEDVRRLLATLGYVSRIRSRPAKLNGRVCGTAWQVVACPDVPVFRLARKNERQTTHNKASNKRRFITSIEPVDSVPVRCITVDSPNSLYLAGEQCIPTHNTFSARAIVLAAAMDPHVRLHVYDLKGSPDWTCFRHVAHRWQLGDTPDPETGVDPVRALLDDLTELRAEVNERYRALRRLPVSLCPQGKLTEELARNLQVKMPLVLFVVDEVQRAFKHKELGKQLEELLEDLVKVAPGAGIIMLCATQKPDKDSTPTSFRDQFSIRFALRVTTYHASEAILGQGAYGEGLDASKLAPEAKGAGLLRGTGDDGDAVAGGTVRTYLADGEDAEVICLRARELRAGHHTLSGAALGDMPASGGNGPDWSVAEDVLIAMGGDDQTHSDVLCARLATQWPDRYPGWTPRQLQAALSAAPFKVQTRQVWADAIDGERRNRKGVRRAELVDALGGEQGEVEAS